MKNIAYVQAKLPSQIKPKEINMSDVDELLKRLHRLAENLKFRGMSSSEATVIEAAAIIRALKPEVK